MFLVGFLNLFCSHIVFLNSFSYLFSCISLNIFENDSQFVWQFLDLHFFKVGY